jgi:hypothetical protein
MRLLCDTGEAATRGGNAAGDAAGAIGAVLVCCVILLGRANAAISVVCFNVDEVALSAF